MRNQFLAAVCCVLVMCGALRAQNRPIVGPVITLAPQAGVVPLTSRANASQTANLFEATTSGGTVQASFASNGDLKVSNSAPRALLNESDQGADSKLWQLSASANVLSVSTRTDADTAGADAWTVTRSGTLVATQVLSASTSVAVSVNASTILTINTTNAVLASTAALAWSTDLFLVRDAANVLAVKNGTSAQAFRVYGTTTGSKYLTLDHNGTNGTVSTSAGNLTLAPTTDVYFRAHHYPESDNTYTAGSAALRWTNVHSVDVTSYDADALIKSGVALTNGAAAAAGTLLNAPAAGNPTKWFKINDNGTVRYVPAW